MGFNSGFKRLIVAGHTELKNAAVLVPLFMHTEWKIDRLNDRMIY